jgi:hypothetical protein
MMKRYVTRFAMLFPLFAFGTFAPANAGPPTYTFTYSFNIPVAIKELGPPGTQLYVQCYVYNPGGSGSTAFSLDATGSYNSTVPVSVQTQATRASTTWKCTIPQGNTPQGALLKVPPSLANGVSGSIPPR